RRYLHSRFSLLLDAGAMRKRALARLPSRPMAESPDLGSAPGTAGDATAPVHFLSRQRDREGVGTAMVERRGALARAQFAGVPSVRLQLADSLSVAIESRGMDHFAGGGWLLRFHLAARHPSPLDSPDGLASPGHRLLPGARPLRQC